MTRRRTRTAHPSDNPDWHVRSHAHTQRYPRHGGGVVYAEVYRHGFTGVWHWWVCKGNGHRLDGCCAYDGSSRRQTQCPGAAEWPEAVHEAEVALQRHVGSA